MGCVPPPLLAAVVVAADEDEGPEEVEEEFEAATPAPPMPPAPPPPDPGPLVAELVPPAPVVCTDVAPTSQPAASRQPTNTGRNHPWFDGDGRYEESIASPSTGVDSAGPPGP